MHYQTTITEKGQITLPAAIRRQLKLTPGKKLSVSLDSKKQHIIIDSPPDMQEIQRKNREMLLARGFTPERLESMAYNYNNGDGWTAHVREKYGDSRQS